MSLILEPSDDNARSYSLFFSEVEHTSFAEGRRVDELLPKDLRDEKVGCPLVGFNVELRELALCRVVDEDVSPAM